jgi:DNA end-binding protein Ku
LRPHDPYTGEEVKREEVLKGYEYERGQFITLTKEELKALDVESSKIIDLDTFVPRAEVDPVFFDTPYHVYPDGPVPTEAFRVIGAALTETGMAEIGRITLTRRDRMVMVKPRGTGMVLITLRAADEVRPAEFSTADEAVDPEMVAIAAMIIKRRAATFDRLSSAIRYQEALRELIEAKMKGLPINSKTIAPPRPAIDLMAALKRALAETEVPATERVPKRKRTAADRRQRSLLLPVAGGRASEVPAKARPPARSPGRQSPETAIELATATPKRRRKA